eukprot:COSAG06_NODE_3966_length_4712_cov_3.146976_2_plen_70_part_00
MNDGVRVRGYRRDLTQVCDIDLLELNRCGPVLWAWAVAIRARLLVRRDPVRNDDLVALRELRSEQDGVL